MTAYMSCNYNTQSPKISEITQEISTPRPISRQRIPTVESDNDESSVSSGSVKKKFIDRTMIKPSSESNASSSDNKENSDYDSPLLALSSNKSVSSHSYNSRERSQSPIQNPQNSSSEVSSNNSVDNKMQTLPDNDCTAQLSADALNTSRYESELQYFKDPTANTSALFQSFMDDLSKLDSSCKTPFDNSVEASPIESQYNQLTPVFSKKSENDDKACDTTIDTKKDLDIETVLDPNLVDSLGNEFNDQVMSIVKDVLIDTQNCLNGFKETNETLLKQKYKIQEKAASLETQLKANQEECSRAREYIKKLEEQIKSYARNLETCNNEWSKKYNEKEAELKLEIKKNEIILEDFRAEMKNQKAIIKQYSARLKAVDKESAVIKQAESLEKSIIEYRDSIKMLKSQLKNMHDSLKSVEEENHFLHQKNSELKKKYMMVLAKEEDLHNQLEYSQKQPQNDSEIESVIQSRVAEFLEQIKRHYRRKIIRLKNLVRYFQKKELTTTQMNDKMLKKFLTLEELNGSQVKPHNSKVDESYFFSEKLNHSMNGEKVTTEKVSPVGYATACFWPSKSSDYREELVVD